MSFVFSLDILQLLMPAQEDFPVPSPLSCGFSATSETLYLLSLYLLCSLLPVCVRGQESSTNVCRC